MANEKIGILFVVALVGALIGGYLGGAFGLGGAGSPAGQLYKGPGDNCYYQTVTGEFIPSGSSNLETLECEYYGDDNYDAFVQGYNEYATPETTTYYDTCTPGNMTNETGVFKEFYCTETERLTTVTGECDCDTVNVTGQCIFDVANFVVASSSTTYTRSCMETDTGNDPYVLGQTTVVRGIYGQAAELCSNTTNVLTERSCIYSNITEGGNASITTTGTCTLGCQNGACVKSKQVLICNQVDIRDPLPVGR